MSSPSALLNDMTEAEVALAASVIQNARRENEEKARKLHLLNTASDDEIISAAQSEYIGTIPPITLANRYDKDGRYIYRDREIWFRDVGTHPRRPVIMKGARAIVMLRWARSVSGGDNGYVEEVLSRLVRAKKITALDHRDLEKQLQPYVDAMHGRFRLTYHFNPPFLCHHRAGDCHHVLIKGKEAFLSESEYRNVKALRAIIEKCENLEDRKRRVVELMKKRMGGNA